MQHGVHIEIDCPHTLHIDDGVRRMKGRDPFSTGTIVETWALPGGGSPDMGNVTADGSELWVAGRYDDEVYVFDAATGKLAHTIPVGRGPHGLCVWPQSGRFWLGHTRNMR